MPDEMTEMQQKYSPGQDNASDSPPSIPIGDVPLAARQGRLYDLACETAPPKGQKSWFPNAFIKQESLMMHPVLDGLEYTDSMSEVQFSGEYSPVHGIRRVPSVRTRQKNSIACFNAQGGAQIHMRQSEPDLLQGLQGANSLYLANGSGAGEGGSGRLLEPKEAGDSCAQSMLTGYEDPPMFSFTETKMFRAVKEVHFWLTLLTIILVFLDFVLSTFRISFAFPSSSPWLVYEILIDCLHICVKVFEYATQRHITKIEEGELGSEKRRMTFRQLVLFCRVFPLSVISWALLQGNPWPRIMRVFGMFSLNSDFDVIVTRLSRKTQVSPIVTRLVQNVLVMFSLMHLGSCGWFYCLSNPSNSQYLYVNPVYAVHPSLAGQTITVPVSVTEVFPRSLMVATSLYEREQRSNFHFYLNGLDFSLKHLCGFGTVGHYPDQDDQILLLLAIAVCGIVTYAMLLGTVTTYITDRSSNSARARLTRKIDELTDTLNAMNMPANIKEECKMYYRYVYNVAGSVGNTSLLDDLPDALTTKVNHQMAAKMFEDVGLFEGLPHDVLTLLMSTLVPKVFLKGIQIVGIGDEGQEALFIQSGSLDVLSREGKVIEVLKRGMHFGENALIANVTRAVQVVTSSSVVLFVLKKAAFIQCALQYPKLGEVVQKNVQSRARLSFSLTDTEVTDQLQSSRIHFKRETHVTDIWEPEAQQSIKRPSHLLEGDAILPGSFLFGQDSPTGSQTSPSGAMSVLSTPQSLSLQRYPLKVSRSVRSLEVCGSIPDDLTPSPTNSSATLKSSTTRRSVAKVASYGSLSSRTSPKRMNSSMMMNATAATTTTTRSLMAASLSLKREEHRSPAIDLTSIPSPTSTAPVALMASPATSPVASQGASISTRHRISASSTTVERCLEKTIRESMRESIRE